MSGIKLWIDLDNSPHIPFFVPIIRELSRRGHAVVITARDAFQVIELADQAGLSYIRVGRHYGKSPIMKLYGLLFRSIQLAPFFQHQRPQLALSHGSRSQMLLSNAFRVPTVQILDYEHSRTIAPARPRWLVVPEALAGLKLSAPARRVRFYRGIKEDVYAPDFKPDPSLLVALGLSPDDLVITVRPPANEAHYYAPESDQLLLELMKRICQTAGVQAVLLPRNRRQEESYRSLYPEWFSNGTTIVPPRAINGLNLLWYSDLVVSGGGTMNREAAALGVPVYSIFRGKTGAVDIQLQKETRLTMIQTPEEIWTRIKIARRDKARVFDGRPREALNDIVARIEEIARNERLEPSAAARPQAAQSGRNRGPNT